MGVCVIVLCVFVRYMWLSLFLVSMGDGLCCFCLFCDLVLACLLVCLCVFFLLVPLYFARL